MPFGAEYSDCRSSAARSPAWPSPCRDDRVDALTLVVGGWLLVVAGFLALGVFTPIEMRAALAGQPVVAALLGLCAAALWQNGWLGRPVAVLLVGAVVYRGCADWLLCLGLLAH